MRRQRVSVAAMMGGEPADGVVQESEDVPLPLMFTVCGTPRTTVAAGCRQWRRAESERKQESKHHAFFSIHKPAHQSGGSKEQATRDRLTINQAVPSGTMHRHASPGTPIMPLWL